MIRRAFLYCLLIFAIPAWSQVNLDSLRTIWNDESAPDSMRIQAINDMATYGYLYSRPDSAFYLGQLMYDFAKEKGFNKDMTAALSIQAASFLVRGSFEDALEYYQKSLAISEKIDDQQAMAKTLNNIGVIYSNMGDFPKALVYHQKSLKIKEEIADRSGMGGSMNNIGLIYMNLGNYPRALDYFERGLKIKEEFEDKRGIAQTLNNIGLIYMKRNDLTNALDYFQRSYAICEEISDKMGSSGILSNIGLIYSRQKEYSKALDCYLQALEIQQEIQDRKGVATTLNNIGEVYMFQANYNKAMDYFNRSLELLQENADKTGLASTSTNIGRVYYNQGAFKSAVIWCMKGLQISEEINVLDQQVDACQCLYDAYKAMGDGNKALSYHERISQLNDSLHAEETAKKLQQMEFERQMLADSLMREEEKLRVQIAHEAEVRRKTRARNILIISAVFLLLGVAGLYWRMSFIRKAKKAIEKEKDRSEGLLRNILPAEIATELKEKGRAEPRKFEKVTILFTDFKEFTRISEKLSPEELVGEINTCFKSFDAICNKYEIEKIKTIGDSYMAAGGLPVPSGDSVRNTVLAGLEMNECMLGLNQKREDYDRIPFEMRVGIHTGPVIAGIVGVTKFQYDIWGDTVNTASRIENAGETGKVTISQSTYEYVKDDPDFKFQYRGKVKTKGKGEVELWFVEKA